MKGWIKLHRKMTQWEWYKNINTFKLFIHCLLIANREDKKWQGMEIKKGQFIRSLPNLSSETGLSVSEVRTAIKNLELTHELTRSKRGRYVVFTIVSYEKYQEVSTNIDTNLADSSQTVSRLLTSNKNYNNQENQKKGYNARARKKNRFQNYESTTTKETAEEFERLFLNATNGGSNDKHTAEDI